MRPATRQWFKISAYDFGSAEAMYKARRYLYVAFLCQQAIEKLLKGMIHEKTGTTPPYSHRLPALFVLAGLEGSRDRLDFLELLSQYYIRARYVEVKDQLAKGLNKTSAKALLDQAKECIQWLKNASKI